MNSKNKETPHRVIYFRVDIPPEEVCVVLRRLQGHSKDRRFKSLAALLTGCVAVLREEVAGLSGTLQAAAPSFDNLLALAEHPYSLQGPLATAFRQALSITVQVAAVLGYHEANELPYRLHPDSTTLIGVGVGLLAAAAVSAASNLPELADLALSAIRVGFRLGLYVNQVSRQFEPEGNTVSRQSWSYAISDVDVGELQRELDRYNAETATSAFSKLYIGATLGSTTCISAPPSRLKRAFHESPFLSRARHLPLPVFNGLYHASHIYDPATITTLLHDVVAGTQPTSVPVVSPLTGDSFTSDHFGPLLNEIAVEFLTGGIHMEQVNSGAVQRLTQTDSQHCLFQFLHISPFSNSLATAIQTALPSLKLDQEELFAWIPRDFGPRCPRSHAESKIAIVGMACRMPGGANTLDEFWKLMAEGRDVHCRVPPDRFDIDAHYDPTAQLMNSTQTPYGNFIDRPGYLDAPFFHMSPREAEQTDPMHRLALVTAYEALEMSGYVPDRTSSTNRTHIGTYYGQAADDYRELNNSQNVGTYAVPAGERGFANGRINYFFKFCGPSFNIDTACSSSSAAVHAACNALWTGEVNMALAGGLNVITDPDNFAGLCSSHFLSRTGQCKVWDEGADGYCRGDGIGCVVLKRLEDAEADNDHILGVILGAATNHSANAISITHPHAGAQRDNYANVMQRAAVDPRDVEYIELHGTGTQAGDLEECTSVRDIFAPMAPRRRADQRLRLGSVKSNIGHGEASAGIASIIKLLLMYERNQIPPHIGIKTAINPTLPKDLEARNMGLTLTLTPWARKADGQRVAVVNGFGAHGGNTTILLEDAPHRVKRGGTQLPCHVITVSAKSQGAFRGNIEALLGYLDEHPDTDIGDLSYTTCARRMHHAYRMAEQVTDLTDARDCLLSALAALSADPESVEPVLPSGPRVAFTFTGQGSLYHGAGAQLYQYIPYFRSQVQQLNGIIQQCGFPSILPGIKEHSEDPGPPCPVLTQLTTVILQIALGRLWISLGVKPCAVIGHSVGEYAALVISGALSALDAILLVGRRAKLLVAELTPGRSAMLAVATAAENLADILAAQGDCEIACINSGNSTTIAGPVESVSALRTQLVSQGYLCTLLDMSFAFHSSEMDAVLPEYTELVRKVNFATPQIPVISPLMSNCVEDASQLQSEYLARALREPVNFAGAIAAAQRQGVVDDKTVWIDIGPHPVSSSFVRNLIPGTTTVPSLQRGREGMATLMHALSTLHSRGVSIQWNELFRPYETAYRLLHLPRYCWQEQNYWIPYIGCWTLDKGNLRSLYQKPEPPLPLDLRTPSIQRIASEKFDDKTATMQIVTDMTQADFSAAVQSYRVKGSCVANMGIWSDEAFTVAKYMHKKLVPDETVDIPCMDLVDFVQSQPQVYDPGDNSQLRQLDIRLDRRARRAEFEWYTVESSTAPTSTKTPFASGAINFKHSSRWLLEWERISHLISGRISFLTEMTAKGLGSRVSTKMAYTLLKSAGIDYAESYRVIQSANLHSDEGCAELLFPDDIKGGWHLPPQWLDGLNQVATLVMNSSDSFDTSDCIYLPDAYASLRIGGFLEPGTVYRGYVRMFPGKTSGAYAGDVYLTHEDRIVAVMTQLQFQRVPLSALQSNKYPQVPNPDRSRSQPATSTVDTPVDNTPSSPESVFSRASPSSAPTTTSVNSLQLEPIKGILTLPLPVPTEIPRESPQLARCIDLIATETGLNVSQLTDRSNIVDLGIDSLMSLALVNRFQQELQLQINKTVFIECSTIGEFKAWFQERYS